VRTSELWSASDILVGDALRSCRLAVLCACESGAGAGRGDETPGLAAALSLAGVDTVVGSLWRVEEPLAALWVDLFYEHLTEEVRAGRRALRIPQLVGAVAERLRGMARHEAQARLFALADSTDDPFVRLGLEAYAERLGDPPFADAWRWAAFYAAGGPTVELAGAPR
jgi:CHAT domain-containing protein